MCEKSTNKDKNQRFFTFITCLLSAQKIDVQLITDPTEKLKVIGGMEMLELVRSEYSRLFFPNEFSYEILK